MTSFFHRFLFDFCSELGLPKLQKSLKCRLFYSSFLFFTLFKIRSILNPILVPTWLHFPSQNPLKSFQKSILKGIDFLIDFCIDFLSIRPPSWDPSWGHVGHIFAQNGAVLWRAPLFFVGSMLFFDFLVVLAPLGSIWARFGRVWASILEVFGLHFGGFWSRFASHVACNFGTF